MNALQNEKSVFPSSSCARTNDNVEVNVKLHAYALIV